jgi:hypothetical protein
MPEPMSSCRDLQVTDLDRASGRATTPPRGWGASGASRLAHPVGRKQRGSTPLCGVWSCVAVRCCICRRDDAPTESARGASSVWFAPSSAHPWQPIHHGLSERDCIVRRVRRWRDWPIGRSRRVLRQGQFAVCGARRSDPLTRLAHTALSLETRSVAKSQARYGDDA